MRKAVTAITAALMLLLCTVGIVRADSMSNAPGAGGFSPGGSSGQIQYNNSGAFGGFTMSGDMTVNTGTGAATLKNSGATAGSYTNLNATIDAQGRVTAASNGSGALAKTTAGLAQVVPTPVPPSGIVQGAPYGYTTKLGTVVEYATTTAATQPGAMCVGADGNVWVGYGYGNLGAAKGTIAKFSPSGVCLAEYATSLDLGINDMCLGGDGNIWYVGWAGGNTNKIGKIDTSGTITEYAVLSTSSTWGCVIAAPDGNLWVSGGGTNDINVVSTAGSLVTTYAVPGTYSPVASMCVGADGNVWGNTLLAAGLIGYALRVTPAGVMTAFSTASSNFGVSPGRGGIILGSDGRVWMNGYNSAVLAAFDTSGAVTLYSPGVDAFFLTTAPDGRIYGARAGSNQFFAFDTAVQYVSTYTTPTANTQPLRIITGPGGNIWMTEYNNAAIAVQPLIKNVGAINVGGGGTLSNITFGTATFSTSNTVDVTDASVTASTIVIPATNAGTAIGEEFSYSVTAGSKFTLHSTNAASTATVGYLRIN